MTQKTTSSTDTRREQTPAEILREPFKPEQVGKLPRVTCKDCSDNRSQCQRHRKQKCDGCGNWISTAHIHLDYVGHAATTDRLLRADPEWTWEPLALNPQTGLPMRDDNGGLWIRLTVGGVTRLGYGDAQGKPGGNAVKEAIGDALRNAAMRFGVALDLWAKEDLHADEPEQPDAEPVAPADAGGEGEQPPSEPPQQGEGQRDPQPQRAAQGVADLAKTTGDTASVRELWNDAKGRDLLDQRVTVDGQTGTLAEYLTMRAGQLAEHEGEAAA